MNIKRLNNTLHKALTRIYNDSSNSNQSDLFVLYSIGIIIYNWNARIPFVVTHFKSNLLISTYTNCWAIVPQEIALNYQLLITGCSRAPPPNCCLGGKLRSSCNALLDPDPCCNALIHATAAPGWGSSILGPLHTLASICWDLSMLSLLHACWGFSILGPLHA